MLFRSIRHANVLCPIDVVEEDGIFLLVYSCVGETLEERLARQPMTRDEITT